MKINWTYKELDEIGEIIRNAWHRELIMEVADLAVNIAKMRDTVPAMLEPGTIYLSRETIEKFNGVDLLKKINNAQVVIDEPQPDYVIDNECKEIR